MTETISLREFLETRIGLMREHADLWRQSHERGHTLERENAVRASETLSERLATMNEVREQLNKQSETFARSDVVAEQVGALQERCRTLELRSENLQGRFWALGVGLTLLVLVVNIGLQFVAIR